MLKSILSSHYNRMILLIIILTVIYISLIIAKAFGETEDQCINYSSKHLIIIGMKNNIDGCNWLVDKLLYNGSGFHVSGYGLSISSMSSLEDTQRFVLTK